MPSAFPAAAPGGLLGRDQQLDELAQLIGGERLLTLTGAPGIGKSRLALELAHQLDDRLSGGAYATELASVARAREVTGAVACALSVDDASGRDLIDALVARLCRRPALVVLDNCEHLLDACGRLTDALLQGCPELRIVVTSRQALGLAAETVWDVPPLAVPRRGEASLSSLARCAAVALFVERAGTVQPAFALNAHVAPAVAEICRRLDGIPLAIELAAARVDSLTPREILLRLDGRLDVLTNGSSTAAERHQTLSAALDWSHDLLSDPERALLRRLSVFAGGFQIEAAEAVGSGKGVRVSQVAGLLARLAAKSLVVIDATGSRPRLRLLETIRAYAGERLERAGETGATRHAHARFCLALAERAEPELTGARQQDWLDRLEAERTEVRLALEWSLSQGKPEQALRLVGALVLFWRVRCHFNEGRELLDAAISASRDGAPPALRAKAVWGTGFMALMASDMDAAIPALEESLSSFRELGDRQGAARALLLLGNCMQFHPGPSALSLLEESAALAREVDDPWCLSHALGIAGLEHERADFARRLFEECLLVARQAGDRQGLRLGLLGLGSIVLRQGDFELAQPLLEEAVATSGAIGEHYGKATALRYLSDLATGRGDYGRARGLLDEALALLREFGPPGALALPLALRGRIALAEGDRLGAQRLLEEALSLARAPGDSAFAALCGMGELAAEDGDIGAARHRFEEALGLARTEGDNSGTARALHGLAELARAESDVQGAARLHVEALRLRREIGEAPGIAASLEAVAGLDPAAGGYEHSARLLGAAQALREANGYARPRLESSRYEVDMEVVREGLCAGDFEAALAKGAELSIEEAVEVALRRSGRRGRSTGGWSSLTPREQQVAALVADGLGSREVAERLLISHWTVKTHLSHTYSKLGIAGRTALAREFWRARSEAHRNER